MLKYFIVVLENSVLKDEGIKRKLLRFTSIWELGSLLFWCFQFNFQSFFLLEAFGMLRFLGGPLFWKISVAFYRFRLIVFLITDLISEIYGRKKSKPDCNRRIFLRPFFFNGNRSVGPYVFRTYQTHQSPIDEVF